MHTVHGNNFFMEFHRDQSLVHLFSTGLFYFLEGVAAASYTDDTTPYNSANRTKWFSNKRNREFSKVLFKWFDFNYM